ncbi:hypothetical protein SCCGRSA3_01035 [Marine Group I thaumarchaeote SCGC RSA3]|uniref:Uncharacterized protein n=2 Tax=Marine Group I TaxID=905826 RepID=A0A087RT45_9ARCH|nr:hypothetical protein AAA799D11_00592 [Marine Group I thaumarchaeote SCGC AAA799-D11]KFM18702.1 hypothetical protein SCCGRSA3_01035 [Marine Group I thaumarchaeote SCGC RSA3]
MEINGNDIPHMRGRPTKKDQQKIQEIIECYFGIDKTYEEIAIETGFNIKTICRYLNPLYEEHRERMCEEILSRHRN